MPRLAGMADLENVLLARWSPRTWDPDHRIDPAAVDHLLEAARWSPSAGNSQPWSFVFAHRGDATHLRLVPLLSVGALRWAPAASLLVVNICHRYVEGTDWDYSEFAEYDLGQSVAHMTIQAQAMGLHARQFRSFDRAGLESELGLPDHWVAMTLSAFGIPAEGTARPDRDRRLPRDLVWPPDPPDADLGATTAR
jgi:nitroreductase